MKKQNNSPKPERARYHFPGIVYSLKIGSLICMISFLSSSVIYCIDNGLIQLMTKFL